MTKTKIARITRISPRNFLIDCAKIFHLSVFGYAAKICRAWQCIKSVRARCQITKSLRCNRIAGSGCKMCVMCSFLRRIHLSISFPDSKRSITLMHVPFQCAINIRPRALVVWYYFTLFYVFIKRLRSFCALHCAECWKDGNVHGELSMVASLRFRIPSAGLQVDFNDFQGPFSRSVWFNVEKVQTPFMRQNQLCAHSLWRRSKLFSLLSSLKLEISRTLGRIEPLVQKCSLFIKTDD